MPYNVNEDLPRSITDHLSYEAQTLFRKVFNKAYGQYDSEIQAFKVAWAAVKKEYVKQDNGMWVKK